MSWTEVGQYAANHVTNMTLVTPTTVAGDVICIVAGQGTVSTPTGFTVAVNNGLLSVWWKIATGNQGNIVLDNSTTGFQACVIVFRNNQTSGYHEADSVYKTGSEPLATNTIAGGTYSDNLIIHCSICSALNGESWATPADTFLSMQNTGSTSVSPSIPGLSIFWEHLIGTGVSSPRTLDISVGVLTVYTISVKFYGTGFPYNAQNLFFGGNF